MANSSPEVTDARIKDPIVRDPIHGFIHLTKEEMDIIRTRLFQRLRGIHQLALASLVYPGALHTRFDHSLGVTHVAGLLADRLFSGDQYKEKRRIIRLAALLHDVGHGPFSHVSEAVLKHCSPKIGNEIIKEKIHEKITAQIITNDPELLKIIGSDTCEKVVEMLEKDGVDPVAGGIVSGPLDADKQDYLLRDSYFCGVRYGLFDIAQLVRCLTVYEEGNERTLVVRAEGIPAIEQFVIAKQHITAQVYRHKVRLISDAMIIRALQLGVERDNIEWLIKLYTYDGSNEFIENYLEWDDARLSVGLLFPLFGTPKEGEACKIFERLHKRHLFKRVFTKKLSEFSSLFRKFFPRTYENLQLRNKAELEVAQLLSKKINEEISPTYVIIHSYSLKSIVKQSRNDEGSILILKEDGRLEPFESASILFHSIDESQQDTFVEIYAPFLPINKAERLKQSDELKQPITEILEKTFQIEVKSSNLG